MNRPWFFKDGGPAAPRGENRPPRVLADVLDALLRERGWTSKPGARGVDLGALWKELLGEPLASRTRVMRLDSGRLLVHVESAAHKCALEMEHLPRLLEEFKARLGAGVVREIRVRVGAVKPAAGEDSPVVIGPGKPAAS